MFNRGDILTIASRATLKVKVLYKLLMEVTPWHSYRVPLAIWDHTVLPATRHKWTHPALTPARQAGTRLMEGWVDLGDLLHTEMVYLPADSHPPKYWPSLVSINYVDRSQHANHCTKPPPTRLNVVLQPRFRVGRKSRHRYKKSRERER